VIQSILSVVNLIVLFVKQTFFLRDWDVNTMFIPQPEELKGSFFFCELILDLSGLEDPAISYATTSVALQIHYVILLNINLIL